MVQWNLTADTTSSVQALWCIGNADGQSRLNWPWQWKAAGGECTAKLVDMSSGVAEITKGRANIFFCSSFFCNHLDLESDSRWVERMRDLFGNFISTWVIIEDNRKPLPFQNTSSAELAAGRPKHANQISKI